MRSRLLAVTVLALLVLQACGSGATEPTDAPVLPAAEASDNPILVMDPVLAEIVAATTTTRPTLPPAPPAPPALDGSTTTTLPPLPVPDRLPSDPYAAAEQVVLGRIEIPKIDIAWDLQQGMTLTAINRGPSQWPGTALPGQLGNMVIAGHRTTYGAPFRYLDLLDPGDEIRFRQDGTTYVYLVTETIIVLPTDLWIADQDYAYTVTLFACHPVGSARQRIVVRGELAETITPEAPIDAA